jgi:hypothetical protein
VITVMSSSPPWRALSAARHLALGLDLAAAARLDQDAEQGVGVEHRLRQGDRNETTSSVFMPRPWPDRLQHADDAQAAVAEADQFADAPAPRRRRSPA